MRDCVIIGAGPAGTAAATVLARAGRDVLAFESARFPRFHVGESMLPAAVDLWKRLGLWERLEGTSFARKGGADFLIADGSKEVKFWFARYLPANLHRAIQVDRAEFDRIAMEHARSAGAEIREGVRVTEVEFRGREGVEVAWRDEGGRTGTERARVVLDCSGMRSFLGRKLGMRKPVPGMTKVSVFAHYENVRLPEAERAGNTEIVAAEDAWYWLIPMTIEESGRNTASVGVVVERSVKDGFRGTALEMMERLFEASPVVRGRLAGARRLTEAHVEADYSFRCDPGYGDGFALIGDAAAFLDPIFSTGFYLSQRHGEQAGQAVVKALGRGGAVRAADLAAPARTLFQAVDTYTRFVRAFYTQAWYDIFLSDQDSPRIRKAVVRVLAGDVAGMNLWLRMFFALLWAQKRWGIVPGVPRPRVTGCLAPAAAETA
ncbi:MAG: tryptophan 7-halogenase [Candidatus Brocadiae bacterium]|nr:tryptophan 7-halogenase [Candidatus Brocadiia bacterium]